MKTALFANGEIDDYGLIALEASQCQTIVSLDGGLKHCMALELIPHIIVGDHHQTSMSLEQIFPGVKVISHPKEQGQSDLELALDYCNFEISPEVTVFGASGGYLDQTLANLYLLGRYKEENLRFVNDNEILFALKPGHQKVHCPSELQTISFLPIFGEVQVNKTQGLNWDLEDMIIDMNFLPISNFCESGEFEIEIEKGLLLCSLSNRYVR